MKEIDWTYDWEEIEDCDHQWEEELRFRKIYDWEGYVWINNFTICKKCGKEKNIETYKTGLGYERN